MNRFIRLDTPLRLFVRNKQRVKHLKNVQNLRYCDTELKTENTQKIVDELEGVDTVYYLIHSMDTKNGEDFTKADLEIADVVAKAAFKAKVGEIIYLGGLGIHTSTHPLSPHLQSRHEVGNILRRSGVSVTEIRAGVIIGAGSASFEIIRALGVKLPFIPKLLYHQGACNPIDIDDVIAYLLKARNNASYAGRIIEIGMPVAYRYDELISLFSKVILNKNLKIYDSHMLGLILNKNIVSRIVSYFSAIPYALSRPLIEGFESMAVKGRYDVLHIDTEIRPLDLIASVKKASESEKSGMVESFWSIPMSEQVLSKDKESFIYVSSKAKESDIVKEYKKHGLLFELRERNVQDEDVDAIFQEIKKIGGSHGYWSPHFLWKIRAFVDKLIGGPGFEVGRKTASHEIRIGERLDFWIVSAYLNKPEQKVLTLKGRIKSPGDSWLQFALIQEDEGWRFTIRAFFSPSGILGYIYWYSLFFVHKYIFDVMIDTIIKESKK
ncbi:DUF2867 domain-containing protein [bacterium]|nr:DUF2867 domain-containing protein [bacterium]MBU1990341.1 DUF2867 domain-containing protein [bacterium]